MRLLFVVALESHWAHGFYVSIWNFTVPSFGKIFISPCHFAIFSIFPSFLIFFSFPLFLHLFTFSILQIIFIHKIFNSDYFLLFLIRILLSPPFHTSPARLAFGRSRGWSTLNPSLYLYFLIHLAYLFIYFWQGRMYWYPVCSGGCCDPPTPANCLIVKFSP